MTERIESTGPEPGPEPGEATELTPSADVSAIDAPQGSDAPVVTEPASRRQRFGWLRRLARRRRFLMALILLTGAGGVLVGVAGSMAVDYSESASFCTKCHVMGPEKKAYELSPHKDVACGECHVRPGVAGFVSAKIAGSKQLYDLITNNYPTPVLPPDHDELPPVEETCLECHSLGDIATDGGPIKLVLRPTYQTDRANSREQVAVVIRPQGLTEPGASSGSPSGGLKGVHWHVQQEVSYTSSDPQDQTIDVVRVTEPDGSVQEYVHASKVSTGNVADAIARFESVGKNRVMDCISCHNRVGHETPTVDEAVDAAMASGGISASLPFIKRDAVAVLNRSYDTEQDADAAIDNLGMKYPIRSPADARLVGSSVAALKRVYDEVATPGMKVTATTYANNLGHQSSPGCFRCHDGEHYKVVKDQITDQAIPSACTTCHTFPQAGPQIAGVAIGVRPTSHTATFVFDHKRVATGVVPTGTACGTCHVPTFCQNCHDSGAIKVDHDVMLYGHAAASRVAGTDACAYCHQASSCAPCHKGTIPVIGGPARVARAPDTG